MATSEATRAYQFSMLCFNCGGRKMCSTIKKPQNITNMIVAILKNASLIMLRTVFSNTIFAMAFMKLLLYLSCFFYTLYIWCIMLFFLNWYSLHARLNSHYYAWSYKKEKHKEIKGYRKYVQKEPTVKGCLLILDLRSFRS